MSHILVARVNIAVMVITEIEADYILCVTYTVLKNSFYN